MSNIHLSERATPISMGFFKMWSEDCVTGEQTLLVNQRNTILYDGADITALALGGEVNAKISHMYFGYTNSYNNGVPIEGYAINQNDPIFPVTINRSYMRIPLTFPAVYTSSDSSIYTNNIVVFTVMINAATATNYCIPDHLLIDYANNGCTIFEAGLVSALDPNDTIASHTHDKVFARTAFNGKQYDSSQNLTISWGIKLTSPSA